MQSQLEWGQKKLIKFEIKNGGSKEEIKQLLKQAFSNSIERWRGMCGNFAWRNFDHSMLVMLQIRLSNHRLIKISMIYVYTKLEVRK